MAGKTGKLEECDTLSKSIFQNSTIPCNFETGWVFHYSFKFGIGPNSNIPSHLNKFGIPLFQSLL